MEKYILTFMFACLTGCGMTIDSTRVVNGSQVAYTTGGVGYQSIDLVALRVPAADVERGPVLVRADGTHVAGPAAMAELLTTARSPYQQIGKVMLFPGIRQLLSAIGPVMYRNKHRLPGATDSCRVGHAQPA